MRNRLGAEHEGTDAIVGDIASHAINIVLHGCTAQLASDEGLATGASQVIERHARPTTGSIRSGDGMLTRGCILSIEVIASITHCLRV